MPGFIYNGKSTKNAINSSELILASFDSVDSVTGMTRDNVSGESTIAHPITNEYGTTYNNLEIEYGLIKKNKKPFTEAEQQIIETWLTSPKISQDIQIYDCENNITDIYCGKFTETEWKPMSGGFAGLTFKFTCNSAYGKKKFSQTYSINGSKINITINNLTDELEEYVYPVLDIYQTSTTNANITIKNKTDNNNSMSFLTRRNNHMVIDCKNCIPYDQTTSIRRMADTALIVNGSITADKINVFQLSAISANLGSITGGSINIGGKFIVDSNGNFTATNGSLTGTVNATTMRAKQAYSVYNDTFATYQDVVKWDGSNLSIGLVGNAGSTGVKGAQIAFLGSQISVGNSSIVCGSISGTNSSFTNVWATNFTNASTFKENITCNKDLKVGRYFSFMDYAEQTSADASDIVYRRPVASAGSDKFRVAILQGTSNNKIVIKAQYNSTNFTNATFTASSSDIRLKEDIKDSSVKALSKIMQMQIREFNWKQTGIHQELGCVADELELIDPLLTTGGGYDEDGTMNIKSIDTLLLSEYAIKGIQELYKQNKEQQKRIEYLESQLKNR